MNGMFTFIACDIPVAALCFTLCVTVHELGHLIGGLLSGYRFSSFEIMGIYVIRSGEKTKFSIRKKACLGQCIMYTENFRTNAALLILGGVIANAVWAVVSTLILVLCLSKYTVNALPEISRLRDWHMAALFFSSIFNTMAVICNMVSDNPANDGNTFADAVKSSFHTEAYNRIMCIYAKLNEGRDIKEIDPRLFDLPDMFLSSLSAELAYFRYLNLKGKDIKKEKMAIKRLEKFASGLIYPEEVNNTGSFGKNDRSYGCGNSNDDPACFMGGRNAGKTDHEVCGILRK